MQGGKKNYLRTSCSRMEAHTCEADHALRVDVPLLVVQQVPTNLPQRAQEGVDWRCTAPLKIVVVLPNLFPEAGCVALFHAFDAQLVAAGNVLHLPTIGSRLEVIAIAAAHVRHVDAQHPRS